MMSRLASLLLPVGILILSQTAFAPFPSSHPYSFLNPVIDPWWSQLDKETQKKIYSQWENSEPSLLHLGNLADNLSRNVNYLNIL